MKTTTTKTLREIIEAIRKNGYKQIKHEYIEWDAEGLNVIGACAIGQAALNLGVEPECLYDAFQNTPLYSIANRIITMNDLDHLSLPTIASNIEEKYATYLDYPIEIQDFFDL